MRRTIEKLSHQRKEKEKKLSEALEGIKNKSQQFQESVSSSKLSPLIARLEEIIISEGDSDQKITNGPFAFLTKSSLGKTFPKKYAQQILLILTEIQKSIEQNQKITADLMNSLSDLIQLNASLTDAKDKEWDALGSNHVGMIFKSMEWRVDKLATEAEDAGILMKKFILLKEKLTRLLAILEDKKLPSPTQVKEILAPLEDWQYTGFENRFRGSSEEVKKQQENYLSYFRKGTKVLDLGCGRGEFLERLEENGIQAEGIEINGQMVDICRDKGLNCFKADILEKLAEYEDGSLGGIFSSQVIEHLPPSYLKRMIETSYAKLASPGIIILETVNPTSVFALVQIYYLDTSHQQPLHPQTLQFFLESSGFEEVEIRYSAPLEEEQLQTLPGADETAEIYNRNIDKLNKILYAPPNYACVGRKV
jgi:O-antigen chain-terminating methyltransferase